MAEYADDRLPEVIIEKRGHESQVKSKKEVKMLTVTQSAKQLLKESLLAHSDDPEAGLRLSMKPSGQLGVMLDSEAEGDQVVEHEGARVLLVASELAPIV